MALIELARRGGRPTRAEASLLGDRICDAAQELFLSRGYGATSIEAVAGRARISKRTLYSRFRDKPDLFRAVIHRMLQRWLPNFEQAVDQDVPLKYRLVGAARQMLAVALLPEALALRRLLLAEAERFPELVQIAVEQGAARGIERIAALLEAETKAGNLAVSDCRFAAIQFQDMVLAAPQRRAMGFGVPMNEAELNDWARRAVALFLGGCSA